MVGPPLLENVQQEAKEIVPLPSSWGKGKRAEAQGLLVHRASPPPVDTAPEETIAN
jgi:hypothetical protein